MYILLRSSIALAAVALAGATTPAPADAGPAIASHRASYVLSLGPTKSNSTVTGLSGGMYLDWHDTCEGWIIEQRMRFEMVDTDGDAIDSEITFSSWEAHDGLSYRFTMRTVRDGDVTEELRGRAKLDGKGKGGKATFSLPENLELDLAAGTIFPTEHSIVLLEQALAGVQQFSRQVFDGATVDGSLDVNAVIGMPVKEETRSNAKVSKIADRPSWRVRMAFFKPGENSSEPEYETSIRMLDNGVGMEFVFDYGEFSIRARMDSLEELPTPRCE
jgi:hypothetical protein